MSAPPATELLGGLKQTLIRCGLADYERTVRDFGQVPASEDRERGRHFSLSDHIRGLVRSLLSSQRPWGPIAANMERIDHIFLNYDPDKLLQSNPAHLAQALRAIRCGNRVVKKQMETLADSIRTMQSIEVHYGSMDAFVTKDSPDAVARQLSRPGLCKLRQVGYTLALEYLRNVGIRAGKPDVHVRRVLSSERLGYADEHPSEQKAYDIIADLAEEAACNPTYLDNLLWLFCARDYGNVCRAHNPSCPICVFRLTCNFPERRPSSESILDTRFR